MRIVPRSVSLRFRLLAATIVALVAALVLSGVVLSGLFRDHVSQQMQATLTQQLDQLTARLALDAQGNPQIDARSMADPRWNKPYSGLYWQLNQRHPDGVEQVGTLRSRSLWDTQLNVRFDTLPIGDVHQYEATGPMGAPLMLLERTVYLTDSPQHFYRLIVASDMQLVYDALARFNGVLAGSMAVLCAMLIGAAWVQVAVGLQPLRSLQQAVVAVREGNSLRLEGQFPAEVQPLVSSFNAVLQRNAEVLERARLHAGNLAHALKTPLTILEQAAMHPERQGSTALPDLVREQVATARSYMDWHLARARMAANVQLPGQRSELAALMKGLLRVLERAYFDKNLTMHTALGSTALWIAAEEQDVQEILGNLLDNACKWAKAHVYIKAKVIAANGTDALHIRVQIDDDGPGIDAQNIATVLARGTRLDETVPGSGLGLSIVRDLVALYGGQIELAASIHGGLQVTLYLPAAIVNNAAKHIQRTRFIP